MCSINRLQIHVLSFASGVDHSYFNAVPLVNKSKNSDACPASDGTTGLPGTAGTRLLSEFQQLNIILQSKEKF